MIQDKITWVVVEGIERCWGGAEQSRAARKQESTKAAYMYQ